MTDRDRRLAASLERLVPRRIERDEWDEIVARADRRVVPIRRFRVPRRALAASGVVLAAVVGALLVASPWRNGPSVIANASAALAAPAGSVVYEEVRFPATERLCVTSQPGDGAACPLATVERTRLWV